MPIMQIWLACRNTLVAHCERTTSLAEEPGQRVMFWAPCLWPALRFSAFFASYGVLASDECDASFRQSNNLLMSTSPNSVDSHPRDFMKVFQHRSRRSGDTEDANTIRYRFPLGSQLTAGSLLTPFLVRFDDLGTHRADRMRSHNN